MMHQEGPYWDFKREWYDDSKDGDLLIDIICMANNLVDRDAYIIIGVNEECDYAIQDVSQDANRRNTQMLTDFIRGKKFAGDFRPVVTVEQVHLDGGLVDVIVVHNSINTPYYLKEKYKGIFANNIYVRLQDSNTPVDKSADFHHVEYLWKKRFGMLLSPIEKVKLYLKYPEHWANSPSSEDKKYYKYAPEFTIDHTYEPEDGRDGYEYYLFAQTDSRPHWSEIRICYHQTVLAELGGVILDGGRYFTTTPDRDGISLTEYHNWDVPYRYMVKGNLNHLVHEFYYVDDGDEARHSHNEYEGCILIFEDEKEHQRFKIYVRKNWDRKDEFVNDIYPVYMNDEEAKLYADMEEDLFIPLKKGEITAANAAALSGKLLQMANGAVYSDDGDEIVIHDQKLDALEDMIEAANGRPVMVAYWFKHDLSRIMRRLTEKKIPFEKLDSEESIRKWNRGELQVALIHPASAGHGLNLQSGGNMLIWFGLTWSLELYQQTVARLWRQGQTSETVVVQHIITAGTIDEDVMKALASKDMTQNRLIAAVKARVTHGR